MSPRDRRALLILALWGAGLGAYFAGKALVGLRRDWKAAQARIGWLEARKRSLAQVLEAGSQERARHAEAFPKEWSSLSLDQLRLKGQDGLLAAVQRAGLGGVRLRAESLEQATAGRELGWTLEGEGSLMQWVGAFDAIERSQPFLRIQAFRLELPGDPWHPEGFGGGQDEAGPLLKGSLKCTWIVGP